LEFNYVVEEVVLYLFSHSNKFKLIMRRITILLATILAVVFITMPSQSVKAQGVVEFSGWGGYMLGGRVDFYEGRFKMNDDVTYGGAIAFEMSKNNFAEISYSNTSTTANFIPYRNGYNPWTGDIGINYIQIGSVRKFDLGGPIEPFAGISLGTAILNIKQTNISDVWRFSMAFKGGLNIFLTENIGIKLQARMLIPMYFAGLGFFVGVGSGGTSSGLSLNAGALALQGDFTGGLIMRFGK